MVHISSLINTWKASSLSCCSEDKKLIRIVLMKTNREAGNCWQSLLEGEYAADPWVQDQMQRKLTLERFQREVALRSLHKSTYFVLWKTFQCLSFHTSNRILDLTSVGQRFLETFMVVDQIFPVCRNENGLFIHRYMGYFELWPFFVWN